MDLGIRIVVGLTLLPVLALIAFGLAEFLRRTIDYYAEGLASIVRSLADIHGGWPEGATLARGIARVTGGASLAFLWLAALSIALLYPQVRWISESTAALALALAVFTWIPASFLQHMFAVRR